MGTHLTDTPELCSLTQGSFARHLALPGGSEILAMGGGGELRNPALDHLQTRHPHSGTAQKLR